MDGRSGGMAVIRGLVRLDRPATLPRQATLCVRLVDATECDAPAVPLATFSREAGGFRRPEDPIPFLLEARLDDPRRDYLVVAHVNLDGIGPPEPGDFITTESFPLTEDFRLNGPIVVHPIGP